MSAKVCTCNEPRLSETRSAMRSEFVRGRGWIKAGPFHAYNLRDEKQGTRLLRRTARVTVVGQRLVESVEWQDVSYPIATRGHRRDCPMYVHPKAHVARKRR